MSDPVFNQSQIEKIDSVSHTAVNAWMVMLSNAQDQDDFEYYRGIITGFALLHAKLTKNPLYLNDVTKQLKHQQQCMRFKASDQKTTHDLEMQP